MKAHRFQAAPGLSSTQGHSSRPVVEETRSDGQLISHICQGKQLNNKLLSRSPCSEGVVWRRRWLSSYGRGPRRGPLETQRARNL